MGFSGRKHFLPAPTDSLVGSTVDEAGGVSEEIETDISRRTDRTSYTIPEDSTPVTISVPSKKKIASSAKPANSSRTSLLIEVYESTDKDQRTSLRVRLPPPGEATGPRTVQGASAERGAQKPSITKRIPLTKQSLERHHDQEDELSEIEVSAPVDFGAARASDISGLSQYPELKYAEPGSDISSMPGESNLGARNPHIVLPRPAASSILSRSDLPRSAISAVSDMPDSNSDLKPPMLSSEMNLSHERITQKAIEKLSSKDRVAAKSARRHSDKSRSRSSGGIAASGSGERRRKSSRHHDGESSLSTGTELSQISNSVVSAGGKSAASGASNITNPKLLQTVEDAIRRLILPELLEIKRNGSQRKSYREEDYSDISENSIAREKDQSRRVSSGSKSRRRSGKDHGSSSRHRSNREYEYDSESISSISEEKHRNRGLVAGALAGAAVAGAALHHQDSTSTLDREERRRRRKRSKSRSSRSASVNESEEIFEKHDVPPMPFVSEISSDLTRSSILSSNTANTATPTQRDVREVIKGSPLVGTSGPQTPTRLSGDLRNSLGLHHRNVSGHDLAATKGLHYDDQGEPGSPEADYTPETVKEMPYHAHASPVITDPERMRLYEQNLHQQHPIRRGLSPIASVASYATTEPARNSIMHARSVDSIGSAKHHHGSLREEASIGSFSSASPGLQKHVAPKGMTAANTSTFAQTYDREFGGKSHTPTNAAYDDYDDVSSQTDDYRDSYTTNDEFNRDSRRMTGYTDDSADLAVHDKLGSGQHVARGIAANPEYVHTPTGVESAVASLIEPSVVDAAPSPQHMHPYAAHRETYDSYSSDQAKDLDMSGPGYGSATRLKQYGSPPQSPAESLGKHKEELHATPGEQKSEESPESEITTNPSVIQGPIGGLASSSRDPWSYAPNTDRATPNFPAQQALNRDLGLHASDLVPQALNVSQRNTFNAKPELYPGETLVATPPGHKDEGYATGDTGNHRSPGPFNKQQMDRDLATPNDLGEDPFTTKRNQYTSGLSQGMSPLYDAATGRGIDRIQSKDIVALMDHLTVRDAQRNARDTEILVTLVRSAAEMRNQFEDMKKFISEQDDLLLGAGERQHEKTQRVIGGPRPLPSSRSVQRSTASQDDLPTKRRNIFQRAVQRLGSKNETELQNIEHMLMQLLRDVEDLRGAQNGTGTAKSISQSQQSQHSQQLLRSVSESVDHVRAPTDPGYEPEGQAGTSSTGGDRSGLLSGASSRQAEYLNISGPKSQPNRVSTVEEEHIHEGEYDDYEDDGEEEDKLTPNLRNF